MALDESEEGQGHLVGVAINSVKLKGQPRGPDDFLSWISPQKDPKMYRILSFLNQVAADIDFYSNYNVDKVMTTLSITECFRPRFNFLRETFLCLKIN